MAKKHNKSKHKWQTGKKFRTQQQGLSDSENVYKLAKRPITQCKNGQRTRTFIHATCIKYLLCAKFFSRCWGHKS